MPFHSQVVQVLSEFDLWLSDKRQSVNRMTKVNHREVDRHTSISRWEWECRTRSRKSGVHWYLVEWDRYYDLDCVNYETTHIRTCICHWIYVWWWSPWQVSGCGISSPHPHVFLVICTLLFISGVPGTRVQLDLRSGLSELRFPWQ